MILSILLKAGAIFLAIGAGWAMGRTIPTWQIDRQNEDSSRYSHSGRRGWGQLVISFMQGAYWASALGIAALTMAAYGWGDAMFGESEYDFSIDPWLILGFAAIAGYVPSRLTDKGPVGPLD